MVTEKDKTQNYNVLLVKTKQKNRKQMLLKRLMLFGLKPSLRMAALKMLMCKKKKISLCDLNRDEFDGEFMFIPIFNASEKYREY